MTTQPGMEALQQQVHHEHEARLQALLAQLEARASRSRVPRDWRHLTAWAQRLGIGDDGLRGRALEQLGADELQRLLDDLAPHEAAIATWAGSLGEPLPPGGAAFLYLQLAAEEVRSARRA